ncbi:MAG: NAD-dependent epimerase/dehydratase family protein [bacterium]
MKILVSGGAGFIGSHIVDAYVDAGHDVAVIDDCSTGNAANVSPRARLHRVDLRDRAAVAAVVARERPEVISHHAAQLDVRRSVADPVFDAQVNLIGFLNLLEEARQHGLRLVVFASSGGVVYGESQRLPTREEDPTEPISPYGVAKLASERYLHYYAHVYGIRSVCLRYANVYGPRQNPHGEAGVIAIFTGLLLDRGEPVINGPGKQTRDYVFVGDVVRANLLALDSDYAGPLNIGSGVETDVNHLFALLCEAAEHHPPERHGPAKAGEQLRSVLDPARAREVLGWRPATPLADGLRRTVAWFRERRAAA